MATGYNVVALPLAAGALATAGILLSPAVGAVLMSLSPVIVAANARYLTLDREMAPGRLWTAGAGAPHRPGVDQSGRPNPSISMS
ncbi:hypothetical protein [Salinibacter sp.]|uniref:hypothetical protein n=1 Tax=Salinibacter sp. TaxID=2065818 RepID=UPI0021E95C7D|nr:hypothetical protein [Salinibacter sp.]